MDSAAFAFLGPGPVGPERLSEIDLLARRYREAAEEIARDAGEIPPRDTRAGADYRAAVAWACRLNAVAAEFRLGLPVAVVEVERRWCLHLPEDGLLVDVVGRSSRSRWPAGDVCRDRIKWARGLWARTDLRRGERRGVRILLFRDTEHPLGFADPWAVRCDEGPTVQFALASLSVRP